MTAEGNFPKNDGDILYASEVNRFDKASNFYSHSVYTVGSATQFQTLGSLVIPPGSLTYPTMVKINASATCGTSQGIKNIKISFSGTDFGNDFFVSGRAVTYNKFYNITGFLGSGGVLDVFMTADDNIYGNIYPNVDAGNNSNPNSGLVITHEASCTYDYKNLRLFTVFQNT